MMDNLMDNLMDNDQTEMTAQDADTDNPAGAVGVATMLTEEAAVVDKTTDAAKDAESAPETYADFTMPEGVEIDVAALTAFKDIAKGLNLSQASAQKVADLGASLVQKTIDQVATQTNTITKGWADSVRADPEIGGDKYQTSIASARQALQTFGNDSFRSFLDSTRLGNHPELIRFMAKVGATTANDTVVAGAPKPSNTDALARLYPKSLKEA